MGHHFDLKHFKADGTLDVDVQVIAASLLEVVILAFQEVVLLLVFTSISSIK
jgi:hypothetical protein